MDISTVPIKERYLTPEDKIERQRRVHVALLTHSPGHHEAVEKKVFTDVETLTKLLGSIELHKKQGGGCGGGTTRLLLVEDLSTTVIEMLGAKFDIDPGFFRGHIGDFVWFNTRDPWVEVPELESCASKRSYFTLRYVQARYFEDERATLAAQMQAGSFNVLRRIYTDGRGAPRFEAPGSDVGLIRSKVSLWVWPHSSSDSGWLGKGYFYSSIRHLFLFSSQLIISRAKKKKELCCSTQLCLTVINCGVVMGTLTRHQACMSRPRIFTNLYQRARSDKL